MPHDWSSQKAALAAYRASLPRDADGRVIYPEVDHNARLKKLMEERNKLLEKLSAVDRKIARVEYMIRRNEVMRMMKEVPVEEIREFLDKRDRK